MNIEGRGKKLKIIIQETDKVYQRSLYEAIVFAAKKYTLAGTTVTKGIMGYGLDGLSDSSKAFDISQAQPVIIEIVDKKERIEDFSKVVAGLLEKADGAGIIYTEDVDIISYRKHEKVKVY